MRTDWLTDCDIDRGEGMLDQGLWSDLHPQSEQREGSYCEPFCPRGPLEPEHDTKVRVRVVGWKWCEGQSSEDDLAAVSALGFESADFFGFLSSDVADLEALAALESVA